LGELKYSYHFAQEEAEICVADATTTEERQPAETVKGKKNWSRCEHLRLPKQKKKKMMSILRSGSIFSARRLKRLQPGSLQKKKKKKQTTLVWLICMNKLKPWREG
jgi:hypothetical protein